MGTGRISPLKIHYWNIERPEWSPFPMTLSSQSPVASSRLAYKRLVGRKWPHAELYGRQFN